MKVGLLWFDDDPARDLEQKVGRAARHYQQKFGRSPSVCYVHPSLLKGGELCHVNGLKVLPLPSVLRHHFWIGEEEGNGSSPRRERSRAG